MSEATDNVEAPEAAAEAPEATIERPEWLPEKFNTPEDLVNSYSSLESKLGKGQEELRETIMAEIEGEAFANRPETAGDYSLPEGLEENAEEIAGSDNVQWWANFAWENGFSQEEFEEGLARLLPDGPDLDAEMTKLGDNAVARIEAVSLWANKNLPDELGDEVLRMGQTADGIKLLEHLMSMNSSDSIGGDTNATTGISKSDLETMMRDPRYWDTTRRDPGYVKQVDEGFSKLYR